jgi:glycerate dehydrogenase
MKICILDTKSIGLDLDYSIFEKFGEVDQQLLTKPEEVAERIRNCNVIITNKIVLNESNLKDAGELKLICITATGTNNIDLNYAKSRGIAVTNVAGYSTWSVAQHTFAMLFYVMEQLRYYDDYVKSGDYAASDSFNNMDRAFSDLDGKTWGIIGLGEIGRTVASVAKAFGCRVVYYSTSGRNNNTDYERLELSELLRQSDVVSIHSPLNEQTKGLIGYNELRLMKKTAFILNLGRGSIVDEASLARALDERLIAGAALDVLEKEPIDADNPLMSIKDKDRLIITPHIAWSSLEARNRLMNEIVLNIQSFLDSGNRNRVC